MAGFRRENYCIRIRELDTKEDLITIFNVIRKTTRDENTQVIFSNEEEGLTYFISQTNGRFVAEALQKLWALYDDLDVKTFKVEKKLEQ